MIFALPTIRAACLCIGIFGAAIGGAAVRVAAQATLPEGPNRDLVERKCGSCHSLEMVAINGRTEEKWNNTIDEMTSYGLQLSPSDRALVLVYLTMYLPPP
jgi:hypothetical protein